jgi:hypothetical protein
MPQGWLLDSKLGNSRALRPQLHSVAYFIVSAFDLAAPLYLINLDFCRPETHFVGHVVAPKVPRGRTYAVNV